MNRNYKNGREKEYRTRKKLLEDGWEVVVRSAGSHSPFDLIAVKKPRDGCDASTLGEILLVQCKPKDSPYERNKAWQAIKAYGGEYHVAVQVV